MPVLATWFDFVFGYSEELLVRCAEHLILAGSSTLAATVVGVPLGVIAARTSFVRSAVLGGVGILQTVPSLAMLTILLVVFGKIGMVPAITALTIYALLPIVANTVAGIEGVPPESVEAATALGATRRQLLWLVHLPLALPVILTGVRTAAVIGVGVATLSAFIGAGGLGQFINEGLALLDNRLILLGAVPAALLALTAWFVVGALGWALDRRRHRSSGRARKTSRSIAAACPILLLALGAWSLHGSGTAVRVGSKNFGEQLILGEMLALLIEEHTPLPVRRQYNLGGSMICHHAMVEGELDVYPEYTGTGLVAVLRQEAQNDPAATLGVVRREYRSRYDLEWLSPFGFDNTYAIAVRQDRAEKSGWRTISDLRGASPSLTAGFTDEFSKRADGYPGLASSYGLEFGAVRNLSPSLMYEALRREEVDVICAFATDGRIAAYGFVILDDDRNFFPPYEAAPVVRRALLGRYPEIRQTFDRLGGQIDDTTMRELNRQVDSDQRSPRDVAREFLVATGLLTND